MREVVLPGGNTTGAVLIGDVVHKPASPWTPSVHAVLRHLEQNGFDGAPRALGFDAQGREMLTYVPGETIGERHPWPDWVYAENTLVQVGEWLRRVHDLTEDLAVDGPWFTGTTMLPGHVVGHQDAAPYNAVMDGDRLVGFVDWDIASPSPREVDIAFSMILWAPLPAEDNRRVHLFLDAYGYEGDRRVFHEVVVQRATRQAGVIRSMGAEHLLRFAVQLELVAASVTALPIEFWDIP
jgi:hypothetical protein